MLDQSQLLCDKLILVVLLAPFPICLNTPPLRL